MIYLVLAACACFAGSAAFLAYEVKRLRKDRQDILLYLWDVAKMYNDPGFEACQSQTTSEILIQCARDITLNEHTHRSGDII